MFRFMLLPLTRPVSSVLSRVRRALATRLPPRADFRGPNDPDRRDAMRATLAGLPLVLFVLSAGAAAGPGCAPGQSGSLAANEVDSFTVGETSSDGMTLQDALVQRAEALGITLAWHKSTAPDAEDCATSVDGLRLVRWDYRYGSSTDARHYLFEVYDETGEPIGNEPALDTVLRRGYTVVVLEVSAVSA